MGKSFNSIIFFALLLILALMICSAAGAAVDMDIYEDLILSAELKAAGGVGGDSANP
ncbi:hypothetical protein MKW94_026964 [Papaver nudicaule]|uniref:Secreted protein n=1 Tax=Papaver nudicaule TaxID=74823 RepID=A0AA41RWC4_PAPNU|nr:hypothetical protein [Papaver nudicaule]